MKDLFNERHAREREAEEIAMEIDEQKRLNQAVLSGMVSVNSASLFFLCAWVHASLQDPGIREHYNECKEKSESLRKEVDEMQDEVNGLNERADQLEMEISNSPLKKKASTSYFITLAKPVLFWQ